MEQIYVASLSLRHSLAFASAAALLAVNASAAFFALSTWLGGFGSAALREGPCCMSLTDVSAGFSGAEASCMAGVQFQPLCPSFNQPLPHSRAVDGLHTAILKC